MKIKNSILLILPVLLISSCIDDKSKHGDKPISRIEFTQEFQEEPYTAEQFGVFTLKGLDFVQQNTDKPVTYRWDVNYRTVSTEKDLEFTATEISSGTTGFVCRYVVENEDGMCFADFNLRVNGAFEEGVLMLSNHNGEAFLSFKRQDAGSSAMITDFYDLTNPNYPLGKPFCMAQYSNYVLLASDGRLMKLHSKTLQAASVVRNTFEQITWIATVPGSYNSVEFYADGEIASFDATQDAFMNIFQQDIRAMYPNARLASTGTFLSGTQALIYDNHDGILFRDDPIIATEITAFPGYELVEMFQVSEYKNAVIVLKDASGGIFMSYLNASGWGVSPLQAAAGLTEASAYIGCQNSSEFYYSKGNQVFLTDYQNMNFNVEAKFTVGSTGDVIKAMALDPDEERLYVAYEKSSGDLPGCLKCFVLRGEHEPWEELNVAGNIMQIMYKLP